MPVKKLTRKAKPKADDTGWRSRIVGEGEEAPDQLLANPANWRIHPTEQQMALTELLTKVGWVQRVVVNQRTGEAWPANERNVSTLVDGHLQVMLALRRDEARVPVLYVDLDPTEEALVLSTLDPIAALAVADREKLGTLLAQVTSSVDESVANILDGLSTREGLDAHTRPEHTDILDQFTHDTGVSDKNERWFYVEFYADEATYTALQSALRDSGVLKGDHEVSHEFFQHAMETALAAHSATR